MQRNGNISAFRTVNNGTAHNGNTAGVPQHVLVCVNCPRQNFKVKFYAVALNNNISVFRFVRFILFRAKELLCNTGLYVKEIAAELDFPSDKAFIQFFFYHEGVYPEQFRRRFSRTHLNKK